MSSVLYPMTHNNGANPIGNQVRALERNITDLRRLVETQTAEIAVLKTQVATAIAAASAASTAAANAVTTAANAANASAAKPPA
jgi:hypothetical protein